MKPVSDPRTSDAEARDMLESLRWPKGPVCPHCSHDERIHAIRGKSARDGLYGCGKCRRQFTVTVGTPMHRSHVPLSRWIRALDLTCSQESEVSVTQLKRDLDLGSYRTAWKLAQRLKAAMQEEPMRALLSGALDDGGSRKPKTGRERDAEKTAGLLATALGGQVRSRPVGRGNAASSKGIAMSRVGPAAAVFADERNPCAELDEWSEGMNAGSGASGERELRRSVNMQLRRIVSFYTRYPAEVVAQRQAIARGEITLHDGRDLLSPTDFKTAAKAPSREGTIGATFDFRHGMKGLDRREGAESGKTPLVLATKGFNGTRGWIDSPAALTPSFLTVARTGGVGDAFVQLEPCAVDDGCLVLLLKAGGLPDLTTLVLAAAALHTERSRHGHGATLAPHHLLQLEMPNSSDLENWVADGLDVMMDVIWNRLTPYLPSHEKHENEGARSGRRVPLSMHGLDLRDVLQAFLRVDVEDVQRREARMRRERTLDDVDVEEAYQAMDEPGARTIAEFMNDPRNLT